MSVCNDSRATSNLLLFNASSARSNKTLSGCLESRLASGFDTFLFVHPVASAITRPNSASPVKRCIDVNLFDVNLKDQFIDYLRSFRLSAGSPRWRPSTASQHLPLDRRSRTRRCLPPKFPHPLGQSLESYPAPRRHQFRYGILAGAWHVSLRVYVLYAVHSG